jgi:hypothetical protein
MIYRELREKLIETFDAKARDHKMISRYRWLLAHVLDLTGVQRDDAIAECFSINETLFPM